MSVLSASTDAVATAQSRMSRLFRLVKRHPMVTIGGGLLLLMIVMGLAAPLYANDPTTIDAFKLLQPASADVWLGTDNLGRDVFARTMFGARISLLVGVVSTAGAALIGLLVGIIAGYSHSFDNVMMRMMDALMSIPTILLAIALVSLTGPGVGILVVAIAIPYIPTVARLVRSVVLGLRDCPYVVAAQCGGARLPKVLWRHILPSTISPLMVQSANVCAGAILSEAALSFLGVGVPPDIPSWGNMIASSRLYLPIAPLTVFAPGIALAVTVLAVNLLGDGLRDLFDPRSRRRD
ncbi:peptide ABC transporter permease [Bradyrhizobium canariense]|uniref:Peptide ABC transporter permease n=1 Tax=Bradyrhizobium canariense TaxID=255045 RepID=A0ABX3X3N6_9BRAD|nr:ABC transporter permease [Bradyrhizobium canariense]OSJ13564.1 peptide ABC transporter permease [Bradyrhizobium canariense]OSJ28779.1 peptide ABC transporter permease [Bradyrhizobium canariense]